MNAVKFALTLLIAGLLNGCTSFYAPLYTKAHVPVTPDATFAVAVDPEALAEKRELCERTKQYLANAGYHIVEPSQADYRIEIGVRIPPAVTVPYEKIAHSPARARASLTRTKIVRMKRNDGRTDFMFGVFRQTGNGGLVWEALIASPPKQFRASEEAFVGKVFSHLGTTFSGEVSVKKPTRT